MTLNKKVIIIAAELEDDAIEEMRLRGLDFWKEVTTTIQKDKNENQSTQR